MTTVSHLFRVAAVAAVVVVLASGIGGAVTLTERTGQATSEAATDRLTLAQTQTGVNNSTVQHVDPETVDEEGNVSGVQSWLGQSIARRLGNSSVQVSRGQYEQADSVVDNDVSTLLGKYVDVAGDTDSGGGGGGTDDGGAGDGESSSTTEEGQALEAASERQDRYVNATRRYNRLYRNYTRARENGEAERARRLALRLGLAAEEVSTVGRNLTRSYAGVARTTGANMTRATRSVDAVVTNVTERQAEIRATVFTRTTFVIESVDERFSFTSPLSVRARLVTDDGDAVSNQTVPIQVGDRRSRVETDRNGTFTVAYRPVLFPTDRDRIGLAYRPRPTAPYLGTRTTLPASVSQVRPNVTVETSGTELRYRDRFTVSGQVAAADRAVPGVPVVVSVGSYRVGRTQTTPDGEFTVDGRLPASVTVGASEVTARVAVSGRAVGPARGTANVTVRKRATDLTLAVDGGDTLGVRGQLTTANGTAVGGQRVALVLGDERVGTVRTNRTGGYTVAVNATSLPPSSDGETLVARFNGTGTNLQSARAEATIPTNSNSVPLPLLLAGLVGPGSLVAAGWWIRRRDDGVSRPEPTGAAATEPEPEPTTTATATPSERLLDSARTHLDAGETRRTVELAYAAVRVALAGGQDSAATHWEFYDEHADALSERHRARLRDVTSAYETTVFAGDVADAEQAVADAAAFLRGVSQPRDASDERGPEPTGTAGETGTQTATE
ncbi:hypothetical protein [Halorientalis litorea]|uniref:hypothetical protein n=1 Tax=Halorientalis litorea TaxID=2931977 RepID=UPI001FF364AE|nr:hypothetical protein [Halorientalis litorea]